jgi:hypothetical protein
MRAYSLGASRSAAHWAAREARYRVLKNAAFEKKWDQIDAVISASAIEQELAGKVGVELAGLLRYKVAKIAFHLLMRVKRGIISV